MRKRPDYKDATAEDLALSLMTGSRSKARYRQSNHDTSTASQRASKRPRATTLP